LSSIAKLKIGDKNPNWRGGRKITSKGYILIYMPDHPFCDKNKCILEHRLIMERHMGRYLLKTEVVHHINGIKDDNRIENLRLYLSVGQHTKFEHKVFGRRAKLLA